MFKIEPVMNDTRYVTLTSDNQMAIDALYLRMEHLGHEGISGKGESRIYDFGNYRSVEKFATEVILAYETLGVGKCDLVIDSSYGIDYSFSQEQIEKFVDKSELIKTITEQKEYDNEIEYEIVQNGHDFDDDTVFHSIIQFTREEPLYHVHLDYGGRSLEEGFMYAIITKDDSNKYHSYLVVLNDGQLVHENDFIKNHDRSSVRILDTADSLEEAKHNLLQEYDKFTKHFINIFSQFSEDDLDSYKGCEYVLLEENDIEMTNFEFGFLTSFDTVNKETTDDVRKDLESILKFPTKLSISHNQVYSERFLNELKSNKYFKTFEFKKYE